MASQPVGPRHLISPSAHFKKLCYTLSFLETDERIERSDSDSQEIIPSLVTDRTKAEKSVRFAPDNVSVSADEGSLSDSLHTLSNEIITWVPSEQLYSEDTFIPETTGTTREKLSGDHPTSTFVSGADYGSCDEKSKADSASLISGMESYVSSDVFSSQNGSSLYKSWRDVTEIVKDIEELEESEFINRADMSHLSYDEEEVTDVDDSFEEQLARQEFIETAVHRLLTRGIKGLLCLNEKRPSVIEEDFTQKFVRLHKLKGMEKKQVDKFCCKAVKALHGTNASNSQNDPVMPSCQGERINSLLYQEAMKRKNVVVENFGLSSSSLDRLKMENLQHSLHKKSKELEDDIKKSETFIENLAHIEEDIARKKFLARMCSHVLRENTEDNIQAHLIKLHPVKCFADFVSGLPRQDTDVYDILYEYKKQLEKRQVIEPPDCYSA